MALIGSLAAPLIALASLAGFVMALLNVNKKLKEGEKAIISYGATGSETFKNLGKLSQKEMTGLIGQSEAYRSSLLGLYGDIGMKYEDALKATEDLTKAGVNLDVRFDTTRHDFYNFIKNVNAVAIMSGESFGEAASQAGELTTEFKKSKKESEEDKNKRLKKMNEEVEKKGRIKLIELTKKGEEISEYIDNIRRKL